ncbi:MAG: cyclopropane-fatty-acyl-phospholipid synthase family protein [Fimbriimonadaceae bacterium]
MKRWEVDRLEIADTGKRSRLNFGIYRRLVISALDRIREGVIHIEEPGRPPICVGVPDESFPAHAHIRIADERFYKLAAKRGGIGVAEAYIKGYWQADDLTNLMRMFVRRIGKEVPMERVLASIGSMPAYVRHLLRKNTVRGSKKNIRAHYDLGNDFFEAFLDPTMTYSSGYFDSGDASMQEASERKLRMIAQKLAIGASHTILELGCGWGSFGMLCAREYGCNVVCVTLSAAQQAEATRRVRAAGLQDKVEIRLQDYRELTGTFDRIVSIEMIEAVGHENLSEFFRKCASLLKDDGAMVIQAISMPERGYESYLRRTDFIREFIFPGSCCPSIAAILTAAAKATKLRVAHLEEFGLHYSRTLRHWREAFVGNFEKILAAGYSADFLRLWHFYLCYCEAGFEEKHVGVSQIVFEMPSYVEKSIKLSERELVND